MARTKTTPSKSKATPALPSDVSPPAIASKIPKPLRFPLLVALNLSLSSLLYTAVSPFTKGDLATVSGYRDQWWEIGGLLGWKAVELAMGWFGGYDSEQMAPYFTERRH